MSVYLYFTLVDTSQNFFLQLRKWITKPENPSMVFWKIRLVNTTGTLVKLYPEWNSPLSVFNEQWAWKAIRNGTSSLCRYNGMTGILQNFSYVGTFHLHNCKKPIDTSHSLNYPRSKCYEICKPCNCLKLIYINKKLNPLLLLELFSFKTTTNWTQYQII